MANGKIRFGKQSGGQLTLVIPDGVSNTEVVLPESGTVATEAYADGKTTLAQVKDEISTGSNRVTSSTGAVGYGTGAGGTVTQLTSKTSTITLNKPTGRITMSNADLPAGAAVSFAFMNNLIEVSDIVLIAIAGGYSQTLGYQVWCNVGFSGATEINVKNIYSTTLSESVIIDFKIIKGAIA